MTQLQLTIDQLLTTTRAVRKRLNLSRPVELEVVRECIAIATQAPTGNNTQHWHFVVVTDLETKTRIARVYQQAFQQNVSTLPPEAARKLESATYLSEYLHKIPVFVIPCLEGRVENASVEVQAGQWGSILPAVWSFMLAARARGLGTAWTTNHLKYEQEVAHILGIPYEQVTQTALIPVAYTIGTEFKPAPRKSLDEVVHFNLW